MFGLVQSSGGFLSRAPTCCCWDSASSIRCSIPTKSGIGFKTADAIAMKLGIEKTAMIRVRAGISYALTEAMDDGHCGLPTDELIPGCRKPA